MIPIKPGFQVFLYMIVCVGFVKPAPGQEARRRWEFMNEIRREKFDLILPKVMRDNNVDMWITVVREGYDDPLTEDFGKSYVGSTGYYIFTDRGTSRIERAALGVGGYLISENGAYDIVTGDYDLKAFVTERDPETIALNYAEHIGAADGLTKTNYEQLANTLGEPYAVKV